LGKGGDLHTAGSLETLEEEKTVPLAKRCLVKSVTGETKVEKNEGGISGKKGQETKTIGGSEPGGGQ